MTQIIDAHQHYWHPARGDYHWMPKDNPTLARAYGPADLAPHLDQHGIGRSIVVQAAATVTETEYLLGIADTDPRVAGVVGWIDFENRADEAHLRRLAEHPKFLGVRPMIQDIADDGWMLRDDIRWAYAAITELDLTFDALGLPQHQANLLQLLQNFPDMRVVLDHCLKPQIRVHSPANFNAWTDGMTQLATQTGAFCKLSGLVTEADGWTIDALRPYAEHVIDTFGPARVMWGSDWPVCRLAASYEGWFSAAQALTNHLPQDAQAQIFGGTAASFYRI